MRNVSNRTRRAVETAAELGHGRNGKVNETLESFRISRTGLCGLADVTDAHDKAVQHSTAQRSVFPTHE